MLPRCPERSCEQPLAAGKAVGMANIARRPMQKQSSARNRNLSHNNLRAAGKITIWHLRAGLVWQVSWLTVPARRLSLSHDRHSLAFPKLWRLREGTIRRKEASRPCCRKAVSVALELHRRNCASDTTPFARIFSNTIPRNTSTALQSRGRPGWKCPEWVHSSRSL